MFDKAYGLVALQAWVVYGRQMCCAQLVVEEPYGRQMCCAQLVVEEPYGRKMCCAKLVVEELGLSDLRVDLFHVSAAPAGKNACPRCYGSSCGLVVQVQLLACCYHWRLVQFG
jgi:hypothetical protein